MQTVCHSYRHCHLPGTQPLICCMSGQYCNYAVSVGTQRRSRLGSAGMCRPSSPALSSIQTRGWQKSSQLCAGRAPARQGIQKSAWEAAAEERGRRSPGLKKRAAGCGWRAAATRPLPALAAACHKPCGACAALPPGRVQNATGSQTRGAIEWLWVEKISEIFESLC